MSKQDLIKKPYRKLYSPSRQYYVVFDLASITVKDEFKDVKWDISRMIKDGILDKAHLSAEPQGISLATLMKYVKHNKSH
jgi:hypothetical protein